MRGTLSPILSHLVQATISAVGEKEKLDRLITKYRKMLSMVDGTFNASEIRFGLADLLITRDEEGDWKEARNHYEFVLEKAPYGYLRSAAMVGKAELAIRLSAEKDMEDAIGLAQRAYKNLASLVGPSDFYSVKCLVVEAELRIRRNFKGDRSTALRLFQKVYEDDMADQYFRARAIVGHSELLLYEKKKNIEKEIALLHDATEYLEDKPNDYFCLKAKLLQGELIVQRMAHYDKSRATGIFMGIIGNKNADMDLVNRSRLDLAEISTVDKAKQLIKEVRTSKMVDQYLLDRASIIEKFLKKRKQDG